MGYIVCEIGVILRRPHIRLPKSKDIFSFLFLFNKAHGAPGSHYKNVRLNKHQPCSKKKTIINHTIARRCLMIDVGPMIKQRRVIFSGIPDCSNTIGIHSILFRNGDSPTFREGILWLFRSGKPQVSRYYLLDFLEKYCISHQLERITWQVGYI